MDYSNPMYMSAIYQILISSFRDTDSARPEVPHPEARRTEIGDEVLERGQSAPSPLARG